MPSGLFTFLQVELPFELGPPDGRWLLRDGAGEVERVLVLRTAGSTRADAIGRGGRRHSEPRRAGQRSGDGRSGGRRRRREPTADPPGIEPATVPVARATVIDPATLAERSAADAWLDGLDPEQAIDEACAWLNRFLLAYRIAATDAYTRALSGIDALALRAGFGEGEQVAEGRWLRAAPLVSPRLGRRARRRETVREARAEEQLAALLGGRAEALLCEELALRARLDLDLGRLDHAALELERAYVAALVELAGIGLGLAPRLAELEQLLPEVQKMAEISLQPTYPPSTTTLLQESALQHALARLEAALRARVIGEEGPWTASLVRGGPPSEEPPSEEPPSEEPPSEEPPSGAPPPGGSPSDS
ncbi:MAG TPA: hypothetical protein VGF95_14095 [Solirubrobacteraceae bacterium]